MKKAIYFIVVLLGLNAKAQLCLDNTFDSDGIVVTNIIGTSFAEGRKTVIQADGKILLAGTTYLSPNRVFVVARYNSNGSLDNTFDGDGIAFVDFGATAFCFAMALQTDGKIVLGGEYNNGSGTSIALARLLTNGSLDLTFSGDGKTTYNVLGGTHNAKDLLVQPDGKIVVSGDCFTGGVINFCLARFTSTGSLDPTFDGDGIVLTDLTTMVGRGYGIAIQSDGKLILVGSRLVSEQEVAVARYNTNGSLDNTFGIGGMVSTNVFSGHDEATDVAIQPDGKIVVSGSFMSLSGVSDVLLLRYNSNGTLDNTFDGDGKVLTNFGGYNDYPGEIIIQPDGKIVFSGQMMNGTSDFTNFAIVRYLSNGAMEGMVITDLGADDYAYSCARQTDGKVVVGGYSKTGGSHELALVRYDLTTIGILEEQMEKSVNVFPNPSTDQITISSANKNANVQVKLIDLNGKILYEKNHHFQSDLNIDITNFPSGMYLVEVSEGNTVSHNKLVKY